MPVLCGDRVKFIANDCNIISKGRDSRFDECDIYGSFSLNMELPYERAIAMKILNVVAYHSSTVLTKIAYEDTTVKGNKKAEIIDLVRSKSAVNTDVLSEV